MSSVDYSLKRQLRWFRGLGLILVLGFLASACNKSEKTAVVDPKAFDSAPAETKEAWASASAAAQTNDYATAYITLGQIRLQPDLTEAQRQSLEALASSVMTRMNEAAQKGDANALKAIQDIRAASRMRGR